MEYLEFKELLKVHLLNAFSSEDISINESVVRKTNMTLDGFAIVKEGCLPAPTIYPSILYDKFEKHNDIVAVMEFADELVKAGFDEPPSIPEFTFENACTSVYFSLINTALNSEFINDLPHITLCDLTAVCKWKVTDQSSFVVNNDFLRNIHATGEEILGIASLNTEMGDYRIMRLDEMIPNLEPDDFEGCAPIYVVSTVNNIDGCRVLLSKSTMEKVSKHIGSDCFYVIPSSRHEILALGLQSTQSVEELKDMICSINAEVVDESDFLSDSLYMYDASSHALTIVQ